ncbi:MAG TPA: hypothetical protein VLL52_24995 [Anaerolineae bacterium]|nr:hypothetical protein [Anaerolineae bacterium]
MMSDKTKNEWIPILKVDDSYVRGSVRGGVNVSNLNVETLGNNIDAFLEQLALVLPKAPPDMSGLELDAFEVTAAITNEGTLALLGLDKELGNVGSIKFVFRRARN